MIVGVSVYSQSKKDLKLQAGYEKQRLHLIQEGWDIVPFPGEFPQNVKSLSDVTGQAQTNWGVQLILPTALKARLLAECKNKVVVKVFDTSGKTSHPYLQQGQLPGTSYTGEAVLEDGNGHGTHCAGIIAADELGVLDVLVDARIVQWKPVKILSNAGSGSFDWITAGIKGEDVQNKQLLDAGTFVVCSGSFGGGTDKLAAVEAALKLSTDLGVLYCFAAGNSGGYGVNYPGNSGYALGVGSLQNTNPLTHSSFESFGPEVWNGMPGSAINSCYLNGGFATLSGTSMATPFEAAAVAIAKSKWGNGIKDTPTMKAYMAWIGSDLEAAGKDDYTGYGIALIQSILDKDPKNLGPVVPPPPPPPNPNPPHATRTLTFSLTGDYAMYWNNTTGLDVKGQTANVVSAFTVKNKRQANAAGLEKLTITKIEVSIPASVNMSSVEYTNLLKATTTTFTNRGLQLATGSDYSDAGYWTAYFYELLVATQITPKIVLDVTRIDFKDVNGKTGFWTYDNLKHWPNQ